MDVLLFVTCPNLQHLLLSHLAKITKIKPIDRSASQADQAQFSPLSGELGARLRPSRLARPFPPLAGRARLLSSSGRSADVHRPLDLRARRRSEFNDTPTWQNRWIPLTRPLRLESAGHTGRQIGRHQASASVKNGRSPAGRFLQAHGDATRARTHGHTKALPQVSQPGRG